MPQLDDQNFSRTVTLICQHNEEGALGIVINRISSHRLGEVFEQLEITVSDARNADHPVYEGGPVNPEYGLILHSTERPPDQWQSTLKISDELALTSSKDILQDIAHGDGPDRFLMSLGYAGWGPTQLEQEIMQNSWFSTPVEHTILFNEDSAAKWHSVASLIGIDYTKMTGQMGHA